MPQFFATQFVAFAVAAMLIACAETPPQDVDSIIDRHIEARGGEEAFKAIRSLVFSHGQYKEGDYTGEGDAVMMIMRPYFKLVGHPEQDPGYMEGYDGAAWEWFSNPGLVVRTVGDASEAIRHGADVEGAFVDYADKGHRVELIDTPVIDNRLTFQVRLTMMDGYSSDSFIDQETFLIVASRHSASVHAFGDEVVSETRIGDYRAVAGVLFPHRFEETEIATGRTMSSMQWNKIEANVDIPLKWFSPPDFERNKIQIFMEQLYVQRADPKAVLWTYRHFRRAYPEEDTRVASEVIGYQTLKMGATETAIALLERNAVDNPNSADSAFGLGRAYAALGRRNDARVAFKNALRLKPGHPRAVRALSDMDKNGD